MSLQQFAFTSHCDADPETVLSLVDDVDGWSRWARPLVAHTRWERWGQPVTAGPGAVRKVGAWPIWIRELILTRDAHGQTYTVTSPALFDYYLGSLTVRPAAAGGVDIEWRIIFAARHQLIAPLTRAVLQATIAGLLKRLTAAAELRARTP
ncbi:SRPBCC family protein [Mycobacterium intracellulare]|uniref:SRPBCC family protein n=1 Tax=Mycobacterium intracellulare TaxID=1767 RepID=UPI0034D78B72